MAEDAGADARRHAVRERLARRRTIEERVNDEPNGVVEALCRRDRALRHHLLQTTGILIQELLRALL
eukprot:3932014-Lingulodinium_polyedra.AAC.1